MPAQYVLGHSSAELTRLQLQAAILDPPMKRLLHDVGLREGASVLDVGTGAGDVALLAAGMVGPSGHVLGLDRSPDALARTRARAQAAGAHTISLREGTPSEVDERFDAVVARLVLMYQPDASSFLRECARRVKPGGVLAFLEIAEFLDEPLRTLPPVPLWSEIVNLVCKAFAATGARLDEGAHLARTFSEAGLPEPTLFCETPMTAPTASPYVEWLVHTLRSVLPHLEATGAARAADLDLDTLVDRLRHALVSVNAQVPALRLVGAWVRIA